MTRLLIILFLASSAWAGEQVVTNSLSDDMWYHGAGTGNE